MRDTAYASDISAFLNELNLQLLGKNIHLFGVEEEIENTRKKLHIWTNIDLFGFVFEISGRNFAVRD